VTRQWYYSNAEDGGSFIYNYRYRVHDSQIPRLQGFQAFRFDAEHQLTGHYYARELRRVDGEWSMVKGWARTFKNNRSVDYVEIDQHTAVDLREADEFFSTEIKSSLEMNYWELQEYVTRLESSGQRVPHLELQVLKKVSMPVVSLVMVLVALPFSFRLGRQGALYGVGIAVVLGIGMFAVLAVFETLGETATIPPVIAAWSPNALFTLFSAYLFLGVRS
jgi:lipopolysaccharide export LptBFGC system permease protein LptF